MKQPLKYFVFNKKTDFLKGYYDNILISGSRICLKNTELKSGIFYSHVMDSLEKDTQWYRLLVNSTVYPNTMIKITVYSSNTNMVLHKNQVYTIDELIHNENIDIKEKTIILSEFHNEIFINPTDMLFRTIKGRYIWFVAEFYTEQSLSPAIEKIKIFIRNRNWIEFLPEVYQTQGSSFTERYMAIFQNLYDSMTNSIVKSASKIDIDVADREMMEWVASWVGIDNTDLWDNEKLRYILKNAVRIHRTTGTRALISEMIELYIGSNPIIIENCNMYKGLSDNRLKKIYDKLYTDSMYTFTVLIKAEYLKSDDTLKAIEKIVNQYKPANMNAIIVVLRPFVILDKHSYIGINSTLGQYRNAVLDGKTAMSFAVLGEDGIYRDERRI